MSGAEDPIKRHAKQLFEQLENPWPEGDRWSAHTQTTIAEFVRESVSDHVQQSLGRRILNVGSHGNSYELAPNDHFHLDITRTAIASLPLACVADAERLPFPDATFELVLCVGSVINYCSAARAIAELCRVLRPGGCLLLEFETSESFEFSGTAEFGRDVTIVRTFYNGAKENVYVYSSKYIEGALAAHGLRITDIRRFHVVSPLAYRITRSERFASLFAALDRFVSRFEMSRRFSANFLMAAHKSDKQL